MFLERVCSLSYPACNAHAPYCRLWSVWLYNIFPRYFINGTIFGEKNGIEGKIKNAGILSQNTTILLNK
jgi:hypothetical protein